MKIKAAQPDNGSQVALEKASYPQAVLKGSLGPAKITVDPSSFLLIRRADECATVIYPISLEESEVDGFRNKINTDLGSFDPVLERMADELEHQYEATQKGLFELLELRKNNYVMMVVAENENDLSAILDILEDKFAMQLSSEFELKR